MNNKKNIKIKHSKGRLYKKRRSPAKTAIEVIVLILIAGGLIYVGYSAAGPLIDYIASGGSSDTVTGWTPAEISSNENDNESNNSDTNNADTDQSLEETSRVQEASSLGTYLIPQTALKSKDTLNSALDAAEKSGFGIVLIPLKSDTGSILYKTQIEYLKDIKELVTGSLSAKEIAEAVTAKGLVPKAVIPTMLDSISPDYVDDTGYFSIAGWSWYDKSPDDGGKRWVDPYRDGTLKYYTDITNELKTAGFEEVVLSEVRYPDFHETDKQYFETKYFAADRYKALTAFYNSLYTSSDKKVSVSVDIKDLLDGKGQSFAKTAELLSDKTFTGKIFLNVNLSDFGETLEIAQGDPIKLPADIAKKAETLIGKASEYIGSNVTIVPVIEGTGISAEDLIKCYQAITP